MAQSTTSNLLGQLLGPIVSLLVMVLTLLYRLYEKRREARRLICKQDEKPAIVIDKRNDTLQKILREEYRGQDISRFNLRLYNAGTSLIKEAEVAVVLNEGASILGLPVIEPKIAQKSNVDVDSTLPDGEREWEFTVKNLNPFRGAVESVKLTFYTEGEIRSLDVRGPELRYFPAEEISTRFVAVSRTVSSLVQRGLLFFGGFGLLLVVLNDILGPLVFVVPILSLLLAVCRRDPSLRMRFVVNLRAISNNLSR